MFKLKKMFSMIVLLTTIGSGLSYADDCGCFDPWNNLSLSLGWRRDDIKTSVDSEIPPAAPFFRDTLNAKRLDVWEVGGQLHLTIPHFDCCCCDDWWWLDRFYVRGSAYRGWISNGKYTESFTNLNRGRTTHETAKIHKGRTVDGTVGLGFLYPVCENFAVGPVGGWSYDQVRFSLKDAKFRGIDDPVLDGLTYTSTWRGPWVGADLAYNWCVCDCWNIRLEGGYEYHWANWRGTWKLKGPDITPCIAFSDHRHSDDAWGQVGYINAWWNLCDCWDVGLGVKYQYWKSKRGGVHPDEGTFASQGCRRNQEARIKDNIWRSLGVTFDIGYTF